jgi:hypothetical protein
MFIPPVRKGNASSVMSQPRNAHNTNLAKSILSLSREKMLNYVFPVILLARKNMYTKP